MTPPITPTTPVAVARPESTRRDLRAPPRRSPTVTHPDLDLERERDLDREWREPSLELAGERAGERLADFPEPCGLALPDAERDS